MIGIKQVLLLASSFLMVCSVFGSDDAVISQRKLHVSTTTRSDSSSKVGKGGKGGDATTPPTTTPSPKGGKGGKGSNGGSTTLLPTSDTDITPSPTDSNSIVRRATPYALFYTIDNDSNIPSTLEYSQLTDVTRVYLDEFMVEEFSSTSLINLDDGVTFMIENSFTFGEPVQAVYQSNGLFNPSSIFLPTTSELNTIIDNAFSGINLDEYIRRVQSLPSANIFSTTSAISKESASTNR
eukprot:scaffold31815_cov47-Attheya_sp.AAC.2